LRFEPLDDATMRQVLLEKLPGAPDAELAAMISAVGGSPGRALGYAGLAMAELDDAMTSLAALGDANNKLRLTLAKALGLKAAQPRYEAFLDRAPTFIAAAAKARQGEGLRNAVDAYETARNLAASARALSLDAQATAYEMAGIVARLASSADT